MNHLKKTTIILFLLICSCIVVNADNNSTVSINVMKIGVIYNLKGSQSALDLPSYHGALIAEDLINKNGGIKGIPIKLIFKDGNSDPDTIEKVTEDLIINESVPVIIGLSDTDLVLPAAKVASKYKVPFITSGASSPRLPEEVPDYLYLACFGDNAQAAVAADYAFRNLSLDSVKIIYDGRMQYTTILAGYFAERFKELGGEVLSEIPINSTSDLKGALINNSPEEQPGLYYIAVGPDDAPEVVRTIHKGGIKTVIFGGDSYDTTNLYSAALDTDGDVYYTTHAWLGDINNQTTEGKIFVGTYQEKFGAEPTPFAGLGYDTIGLVVEAAKNNNLGTNIREGLNRISNYHGITGTISYINGSAVPTKNVTLIIAGGINLKHVGDFIPEKVPIP